MGISRGILYTLLYLLFHYILLCYPRVKCIHHRCSFKTTESNFIVPRRFNYSMHVQQTQCSIESQLVYGTKIWEKIGFNPIFLLTCLGRKKQVKSGFIWKRTTLLLFYTKKYVADPSVIEIGIKRKWNVPSQKQLNVYCTSRWTCTLLCHSYLHISLGHFYNRNDVSEAMVDPGIKHFRVKKWNKIIPYFSKNSAMRAKAVNGKLLHKGD